MSVPLYTYPCLTSTASGDLLLLGISSAAEGTLNAHKLDLSNLSSPVATLYATQSFPTDWTSKSPTACFPYSGNTASIAFFAQFGSLSRFTNIRANGNIEPPIYYRDVAFVSPKLFSFAGTKDYFDFFHVYTNNTYSGTGSSWSGTRFNATDSLYSFHSYYTSQYPSALPRVTVGTFSPGGLAGYSVVFDKAGSGTIFSTQLNTNSVLGDANGSLITLAKAQDVDMNGIKLTDAAIPVTMSNVGYLLDKASDGTTVIYSINPSQSPKLQALSITSDVPTFSTVQSAAVVGSKIITYSTFNASTVFINSFDTTGGIWTGPNLIKAAKPPSPTSSSNNGGDDDGGTKTPLGAIIGGVVGGLVVIALIVFFVVRKRRNGYKPAAVSPPTSSDYQDPGKIEDSTTHSALPLMQQVYPDQQQQQAYYQQQQPYTYTPPTLFSQEQHPTTAPIIFQPQSTSGSSPTYTKAAYSSSNQPSNPQSTSGSSPTDTQAAYSSSNQPSNPQSTSGSSPTDTPAAYYSSNQPSNPQSTSGSIPTYIQAAYTSSNQPSNPQSTSGSIPTYIQAAYSSSNQPSNPQYVGHDLTSTTVSETMESGLNSVTVPPSNPQFVP
ncbi:hypothetical protein EC957_000193 [Mortierella hygrophila]|uniref:Uncharacterized protein n=1 Tax=Mortierella hygrophila TaxID=979708 RepID=A0A9P6K7X7_9FUNG|nr:hypothetical protein EC957_000193 [Mortierella hygrophila]